MNKPLIISVAIVIVHLVIKFVVNLCPVANINVNRFATKDPVTRVNKNHKLIVAVVNPKEWYLVEENALLV